MKTRYVCIHGHFYQPPRENPWLESIEVQDSAHPYHDWNERIAVECYASNAAARTLDADGLIAKITNNYARMSFNFGPTLLSWMAQHRPDVYAAILNADKLSLAHFGHGAAMAQVYNHLIMPLANTRDKITQIVWGIRDFEHRFNRKPKGMWLAEAAVDLESLTLMAQHGIEYTVLAPHQAKRFRHIHSEDWHDTSQAQIDTRRAYIQRLPGGLSMTLFFYDGETSRAVAFERLLDKGETFARRLMRGFSQDTDQPQLVHIATDGETYGHHHKYGEMGLSYAMDLIEQTPNTQLTIYPHFMTLHPPEHEVDIAANTSWSCFHGIERWRSDCGCTNGETRGATQQWRGPLRRAFDALRQAGVDVFSSQMADLVDRPWSVRDAYIDVILGVETQASFIARFAKQDLSDDQKALFLCMLEMQRNAMLMYTSCGWFFDEVSRIETIQLMRYAGRVIQLAQKYCTIDLHAQLLNGLSLAKSHAPQYENAADVYRDHVLPLDLKRVCAHHAINTLFGHSDQTYCFDVVSLNHVVHQTGSMRLALGRVHITSQLTSMRECFDYAVVDMGDHNVTGGAKLHTGEPDALSEVTFASNEAVRAFKRGEYLSLIRRLDAYFKDDVFTLRSLFKDEQRRVIDGILSSSLQQTSQTFEQVYTQRSPLMRFLSDVNSPLPPQFLAAAQIALNAKLQRAISAQPQNRETIELLIKEAASLDVVLDWPTLSYTIRQCLIALTEQWLQTPDDTSLMVSLTDTVNLSIELPFDVDLWDAQNAFFKVLSGPKPAIDSWTDAFKRLGRALFISQSVLTAI